MILEYVFVKIIYIKNCSIYYGTINYHSVISIHKAKIYNHSMYT